MIDQLYTYGIGALIVWMHASDALELLVGVGGCWMLLLVIYLLS